ncbi:hypothetical protein BDZ94DRAFT_1249377 [Collybia nuda]|uniref:DUF6532 domain-containing protein n=1 Tax=Collybia nuda TaxID=64659 RepID=A0A9P5YEL4_9AGAR|nr:hypothetical protein BDZ94DRAFT_1249377 [Collybia nuda]
MPPSTQPRTNSKGRAVMGGPSDNFGSEDDIEAPPSTQPRTRISQTKGRAYLNHSDSEDDIEVPQSAHSRTPAAKIKGKGVTSGPHVSHSRTLSIVATPSQKSSTAPSKPPGKRQLERQREVPKWTETAKSDQEAKSTNGAQHGTRPPKALRACDDHSWPAITHLTYRPGSYGIGIRVQSAPIQAVIRHGIKEIQADALWINTFPDVEELDKMILNALCQATDILDYPEIAHRIVRDKTYREDLGSQLNIRLGMMRSSTNNLANLKVDGYYDFKFCRDRSQRVKELLAQNTFIYGLNDNNKVDGALPYQHSAIIATLQDLHKTYCTAYTNRYESSIPDDPMRSTERKVPIPMVAFAVTMIRGALLHWQTGNYVDMKFNSDEHVNTYKFHAQVLEMMKASPETRKKFHRMMANLYTAVTKDTENLGASGLHNIKILDLAGMEE